MKINFKRISAITFLSIMAILVLANYAISNYLKNKAESIGSKLFDSQVSVGSVSFYYYPLAVTFNEVKIKKNSEASPLKSINIKHFNLSFDYKSLSLMPEFIFINYARVIEPEITYLDNEFTIYNPADEELKICSTDSLKFEAVVSDANEQDIYNEDLYQFIITKLFINKAKFILVEDSSKGKETKVEIADTAIDTVDNLSGEMVEEHLKQLAKDAIKLKLTLPKSSDEKDVKTDNNGNVNATDKKDEIQKSIFE